MTRQRCIFCWWRPYLALRGLVADLSKRISKTNFTRTFQSISCFQKLSGQDSLCPTALVFWAETSKTTHGLSGTRMYIERAVVGDGDGMCGAGGAVRLRAHRPVRYLRCRMCLFTSRTA